MARKSVVNRIRITRRGKTLRRAMGLGHSRTNKSSNQMLRKQNSRSITIPNKILKPYF